MAALILALRLTAPFPPSVGAGGPLEDNAVSPRGCGAAIFCGVALVALRFVTIGVDLEKFGAGRALNCFRSSCAFLSLSEDAGTDGVAVTAADDDDDDSVWTGV